MFWEASKRVITALLLQSGTWSHVWDQMDGYFESVDEAEQKCLLHDQRSLEAVDGCPVPVDCRADVADLGVAGRLKQKRDRSYQDSRRVYGMNTLANNYVISCMNYILCLPTTHMKEEQASKVSL